MENLSYFIWRLLESGKAHEIDKPSRL